MKIFVIASMLFGGGTAAALNNEVVSETITETVPAIVRQKVQEGMARWKGNKIESIKEDGISYPTEEHLELLTEDQQIAVLSLIDQYNAEYDFANLTDEEITAVLQAFHADLVILHDELGIEVPLPTKEQIRTRVRNRVKQNLRERYQNFMSENFDSIRENGFVLKEDCPLELTDEQSIAIEDKVAEINAEYDFSVMTDDELKVALSEIKVELTELFTELEIELPAMNKELAEQRSQRRGK